MKTTDKHIICNIIVIFVLLSGCGDIDNYKAPDSTFYGRIITEGGNTVQQRVQSSTGLKFALYETERENSIPQYFFAKPDGTFENSMLFEGEYRVKLGQTNFYPVDDLVTRISGKTAHNFTVIPFCEIQNVAASHISGRKVLVKFTVTRTKDQDCKIINYGVYGHISPYIDDLAANSLISRSVDNTQSNDSDLLNKTVEMELDMDDIPDFAAQYENIVKANSNQIYIRISVITAYPYSGNPDNIGHTYANFSAVVPVSVTF